MWMGWMGVCTNSERVTRDTVQGELQPGLEADCSNTKSPSLLHLFLTVWSSFTPSDCYFTSSWSKDLESTCPGLVTHERESINRYCFSSSFCKALSQSSTPSRHPSWLSRVRAFLTVWLTFVTLSNINQRSVWWDFNPVAGKRKKGWGGCCVEQIDPKFVLSPYSSPQQQWQQRSLYLVKVVWSRWNRCAGKCCRLSEKKKKTRQSTAHWLIPGSIVSLSARLCVCV